MVSIRRAEPGDFPRIARTATRAFAHDPVMRWFFPELEDFERINPMFNQWLAKRWHATGTLWCTDDAAAMAGWIPPGRPEIDIGPWPAADHPPWRLERFAAISDAIAANTPEEPHWYLNMLATHPDWQRRGLGTALMETVFEVADAEGAPCYLETETEVNVTYYLHHGFEVRAEWDPPLGGPHMWGMMRPAR